MFKQGAIVLIPFPFTDLSGSKVRPALIVSKNLSGDDLIVMFISSYINKSSKYDVQINQDKNNGLKKSSIIKCAKLATLDRKVVLGELGVASSKVIKDVDKKIVKILGL